MLKLLPPLVFLQLARMGALALLLPLGQLRAGDAPGLVDRLSDQAQGALRGSSLTFEAGYLQGTFKATRTGSGTTQLTDNGQVGFALDYSGQEKAFVRAPMKVGTFILGYSLTGTVGQFQVNRQLVNSAFTGTNEGTSVKGGYAAVAPSLFIRMGPLYPGKAIFWSFGVSLGAGVAKYDGTALFGGAPQAVGSGSLRPTLYETAFWRLDVGHWMVVFNGKYFLIHDPNLASVSYENYGLSLGYRITF